MPEASDVPVPESWVSDGNSESFGTSFYIVLQVYLDLIMPEDKTFVLLRLDI